MFRMTFRVLLPVFGAALLIPAAHARPANNDDSNGCTDQTIQGSYAFRVSGFIVAPSGPLTVVNYRDGVAIAHFDGHGHLTQKDFIMANGVPNRNNPADVDPNSGFNTGETGTYQVFSDCTGVAEIDFPTPPGATSGAVIKLKFVIARHGQILHTVVSSLMPPQPPPAGPPNTPALANIHSDAERIGDIADRK